LQRIHVIQTKDGKILQTLEFPEWVNVCCLSKGLDYMAVGGKSYHDPSFIHGMLGPKAPAVVLAAADQVFWNISRVRMCC
jgi:hypothetical protein